MKNNWIDIKDNLPNNDRQVLCYVNNLETPRWSGYNLGSYINEKWYLQNGIKCHEVVEMWFDFPQIKKNR